MFRFTLRRFGVLVDPSYVVHDNDLLMVLRYNHHGERSIPTLMRASNVEVGDDVLNVSHAGETLWSTVTCISGVDA